MRFYYAMLILAVALLAGYAGASLHKESTASVDTQPAFTRVMQSGALRCGYIVFPPQFTKDPNTGQLGGVAYDITTEMAKLLGLKVDWVEEVNFSNMTAGLDAGRYDALCFSLYRWAASAKAVDYTEPLFCTSTGVYIRADDARFGDEDLKRLNSDDITVAAIDGEGSDTIAATSFPAAHILSLPQNADLAQLFETVSSHKADVAFANPLMAIDYMKANPGKLKDIANGQPIRKFCHAIAVAKGEQKLANTLSIAIEELNDHGIIEGILKKYEGDTDSFIRVHLY